MGISDSQGVACDFQGPYNVGEDGYMMMGPPTRYLRMPLSSIEGSTEQWDQAVQESNENYKGRMHNICCDNCHSHVACALNTMGLEAYGMRKWNMVKLCFLVFFKGRFVSLGGAVHQFGPFLFIVLLFTIVGRLLG